MRSSQGDAPWLRMSTEIVLKSADTDFAKPAQFRPEPNNPCAMTSGGPSPVTEQESFIAEDRRSVAANHGHEKRHADMKPITHLPEIGGAWIGIEL